MKFRPFISRRRIVVPKSIQGHTPLAHARIKRVTGIMRQNKVGRSGKAGAFSGAGAIAAMLIHSPLIFPIGILSMGGAFYHAGQAQLTENRVKTMVGKMLYDESVRNPSFAKLIQEHPHIGVMVDGTVAASASERDLKKMGRLVAFQLNGQEIEYGTPLHAWKNRPRIPHTTKGKKRRR